MLTCPCRAKPDRCSSLIYKIACGGACVLRSMHFCSKTTSCAKMHLTHISSCCAEKEKCNDLRKRYVPMNRPVVCPTDHNAVREPPSTQRGWQPMIFNHRCCCRANMQVDSLTQQLRERELQHAERDKQLAALSEVPSHVCLMMPSTVSSQARVLKVRRDAM